MLTLQVTAYSRHRHHHHHHHQPPPPTPPAQPPPPPLTASLRSTSAGQVRRAARGARGLAAPEPRRGRRVPHVPGVLPRSQARRHRCDVVGQRHRLDGELSHPRARAPARRPPLPPPRSPPRRRLSLVTPECARAARAPRFPTASAAHPRAPPLAGGARGGERRGRLRLGDHAHRRPHAHVPRGARGDDDRPARGVGGPVESAVLRVHLRRREGGGRSGARHGDLHAARRGDRAERRAVPGATGRAIPRKSAQFCAIL